MNECEGVTEGEWRKGYCGASMHLLRAGLSGGDESGARIKGLDLGKRILQAREQGSYRDPAEEDFIHAQGRSWAAQTRPEREAG